MKRDNDNYKKSTNGWNRIENNNNTNKQQKKKQIQDDNDDDDTIMTKLTQESSLECKELECNLIDEEDDKYDSNIVIIPTQVLFRMKQNLNWKSKRKQKWKKSTIEKWKWKRNSKYDI